MQNLPFLPEEPAWLALDMDESILSDAFFDMGDTLFDGVGDEEQLKVFL